MGVDRVEEWKRFSEHMEDYIREETVQKYGMGETAKKEETFDLMSITEPKVCIWNVLKYSLRNWNGRGKEYDMEKICHYSQIAWTMKGRKAQNSK